MKEPAENLSIRHSIEEKKRRQISGLPICRGVRAPHVTYCAMRYDDEFS